MFSRKVDKHRAAEHHDNLVERLDRLEASVEERIGALVAADATLDAQIQRLETTLQMHGQSLAENVRATIVDQQGHLRAEVAEHLEALARDVGVAECQDLREAIAALANECSLCASNSRADALQEELQLLRHSVKTLAVQHVEAIPATEVQTFREHLAVQESELHRIRAALSGDGSNLRIFLDEEAIRQNSLRIEGSSAEWVVRDVEAWLQTLPKGKFIESPVFALDVLGVGRLDELRLRFFPNGGPNLMTDGTCSLYLSHPSTVPWAQYELMVGRARRGAFDPIYGGGDDFCALAPEVIEIDGSRAVRLSVHFLSPKRQRNHERGLHAPRSTAES